MKLNGTCACRSVKEKEDNFLSIAAAEDDEGEACRTREKRDELKVLTALCVTPKECEKICASTELCFGNELQRLQFEVLNIRSDDLTIFV